MAPGSIELTAILCLEGSKNTTPRDFFSALILFSVIYQWGEDRLPNEEDSTLDCLTGYAKFLDPFQILKNSF